MTPAFSLAYLAPVVLLIVAALSLRAEGRRPGSLPLLSEAAAALAMVLTGAGLVHYLATDAAALSGPLGLRADLVSLTMALLVSFIGWIVLRYSRSYLDGEAREGLFHGLMLATLAAVLVFVQSGNILLLAVATFAVGLGLKQLLLFYPERPEARRAAAKFALVWHGGDAALLLAAVLLVLGFGTGNLQAVHALALEGGLGMTGHLAVALIVLAAVFKTASFPLHGWLTEVMEAPTPVSALLHAGIINSGGVLLIKAAPLVQESPGAMAALVMLGGFTALFGAAVMLTQSAVKTALAWSTVSQMGFLLLQCGLGLWPLALLHIVAHSLYKAHSFLAAGGAVARIASIGRPGPVALPSLAAVGRAFGLAIAVYFGVYLLSGVLIGFGSKSPQAVALGAVLIFGVAYLMAQGLADAAPRALTRRTVQMSVITTVAYLALQRLAERLTADVLPSAPPAGPLEWALILLTLVSFGAVALAQSTLPLWSYHPAAEGLRVHLANGLYINAVEDRLLRGWSRKNAKSGAAS